MAKILGLLLALIVFNCAARPAHALIISEVHPNPLAGPEWVEIYNDGTEPQSLTNWWLEDQLSAPSIIFHFPVDLTLSPQQYYVANLPSAKLNNDADGVTLKDGNGTIIDAMSYTSSAAGKSWSRLLSDQAYFLSEPSAGLANPSPSPSPTPSPTAIPTASPSPTPTPQPSFAPPATLPQPSEIMACPDKNQTEWVELYNSSNSPITLSNWHIIDEARNSRLANVTIPANGYQIVEWASAMLNNTGDTFSLVEPDQTFAWTVTYSACTTGQSLGLQNDDWVATAVPTPNQANQFPVASPVVTPTPIPVALPSPSPAILGAATTPPSLATPSGIIEPSNFQLQLDAIVDHPFATPSATANIHQPLPKLPALFSVIIGSSLLFLCTVTELYFYFSSRNKFQPPSISSSPNSPQIRANLFS